MSRQKSIREREVEDEYRPRLHRTVGVYLALKAWTFGFACIVLSRRELLSFFGMKSTPRDRIDQIKKDLKPWFHGFIPSRPKPNNPTFVNYLFLIRRENDQSYFSSATALSRSGVKQLVANVNGSNSPGAPKAAFFPECLSGGGVPTQEQILSELVLTVSGLKAL